MRKLPSRLVARPRLNRQARTGLLFLLPSLAGVSVFVLLPFGDVLRRSFFSAMGGSFVGLQNYRSLWQNQAFRLAAGNTLRFMGVCIPLLLLLSLLVAVLIHRCFFRRQLFKTTFLLPMAIPVASVALLWRVVFHQSGLLNGLLVHLGWMDPSQPVDYMRTGWSFWVLVFSYIWKNLGYDLILWLAGLGSIPPQQYEAAQVDGAGSWQCFVGITLPNLLPTLYTITVLSLLNAFKVFREAYLIGGDYPHSSMYQLQHLFNNWFVDLEMDKLTAAAVVVAAVILLLILLLRRCWEGEGESQ